MTADENRIGSRERIHEYYEDEISLTDLILMIWRHRVGGMVIAAIVVVAAITYAISATPVYKATAYFLPPLEKNIEELNTAQRLGLSGYATDRVFDEFIKNLYSLDVRRQFFSENGLAAYYLKDEESVAGGEIFDGAFNQKLSVRVPKKDERGPVSVSFELDNAEKAAEWLNAFTAAAKAATISQLVGNVTTDIEAKIVELDTKIASRRSLAEQRREDDIVLLREALEIARKLDIKKPADYNFDLTRKESDAVSVNTAELPLYTRGSIALEAEIATLQNRKSDDPFIIDLRDWQEQLAALRAIKIHPDGIDVAMVDRPAIVPYQREKPNRRLIVVIGLVLGVFLGLMFAFVLEFIQTFRRQLSIKQN
jgi:chain length determinant protein (polysaccharide antigen chain regulator)